VKINGPQENLEFFGLSVDFSIISLVFERASPKKSGKMPKMFKIAKFYMNKPVKIRKKFITTKK
jgi:hypothetical protein